MVKINRTIKTLIASDLIWQLGSGFIAPVFAIFLVGSIENGSIQLAGAAVAIYWITKSILRIPIAYFLDKKRGEYDDFYSMLVGFIILTACQFLYLIAKIPLHVYLIQLLMGIGGAFAFTPWYGFFSRHIDKHHENLEWSMSVSSTGFGIAAAAFVTGIIADKFGFAPIFILAGTFGLIATALLLFIGRHLQVRNRDGYEMEVVEKK